MFAQQLLRLATLIVIGLIIADALASRTDPGAGGLLGNIGGLWQQSIGGLLGQKVNVPSNTQTAKLV